MGKRRASGDGSITHNKRGLWVARLELPPTYDDDGKPKRRRIEKTSLSQRVVLDWLADKKTDLAKYGAAADGRTTVAEWGQRWLAIQAPRVKPASIRLYRTTLRTWVAPAIGHIKLSKLTPADVRRVTDRMRESGMSATTMHNVHAMVSAMLVVAVRDGLIHDNPAGKVKAPKAQRGSRGAFTVEQVMQLLAAERRTGGCRFATQLLTGMRQGEVLGLTWDTIDLDAGTLTVVWQMQAITKQHGCGNRADDGTWPCGRVLGSNCPKAHVVLPDGMPYVHLEGGRYLIPPKSGKARTVPLLPILIDGLRRHGDALGGQPNPYGLVFPRADGRPLRPDHDQLAWKELLTEAGLPTAATTHWARHTMATLMMQAGVDAKVVGEIVGHSTERITRSVYQHTTTALARDGMRRLGELLAG